MIWKISMQLTIIVFIFFVSVALGLAKSKTKKKFFFPLNIMLIGVFLSSVIVFIPIYYSMFEKEDFCILKTFLLAIHNTIRLFVVDGDFNFVTDAWNGEKDFVYSAYTMIASILFVTAPLLSFGVVLRFFKNISSYCDFVLSYRKDLYVFSEMNEKSLMLAESLAKLRNRKTKIVFADFFENNDESSFEMLERASRIGAICLKNDIVTIKYKYHSRKSKITFFIIGADDAENIGQTLKLFALFGDRSNTFLYAFSKRAESEMLFQRTENKKMKIKRINDIQSLVYHNLYKRGFKIFENATPSNDGKSISAAVIGLGDHGIEMVKSLVWFCQMDGYNVYINAFDKSENSFFKFKALCPELIDDLHNNNFSDDGEAMYSLNIHGGVDVCDYGFVDLFNSLKNVTYVFVALGDDELNVRTATNIRMLCERMNCHPFIQSIVYDENKKFALENSSNYSGQLYDIDYIGDLRSLYSVDVILEDEMENLALKRHLKWGDEDDFWRFEYNRRSSIASAIHSKMKIACGIPGADVAPDKRSDVERLKLRKLEHRRWNAYMRSEGYIFSGSTEKSTRNNLGKTHHCLVTFDDLSFSEQEKDDD